MGSTKAFALGKELAYKEDVKPSGMVELTSGTYNGAVTTTLAICDVDLSNYPDASMFYIRLKRIKMQFVGAMDQYASLYIYAGLSSSTTAAIDLTKQYALAGFEFKQGVAINIDHQLRASAMIQLLGATNESNPDFTHQWYWGGSRSFENERLNTAQISDISRIKYLKILAVPTSLWGGEIINIEADYAVYAL